MGWNSGSARTGPRIPGRDTIRPIRQIAVALECVVDFGDLVEVSMYLRAAVSGLSVIMTASSVMVEPREAPVDPATARRLVTRTPACRFAGGQHTHSGLIVVGVGGGGGGVRAEGWRGRC